MPDVALRLALGTVLMLSGLKLLNVPGSTWILVGGLAGLGLGLGAYGVRALLAQRPSAEVV